MDIRLPVTFAALSVPTFLPGVRMQTGGLVIDPGQLLYPGDILHEAGHLALMEPARRACVCGDAGPDGGEEVGAIAWSYAAAVHLHPDPRVVFHPDGYRGAARSLLDNFSAGRAIGVPMLQWRGLAFEERRAGELGVPPYPHM